MRHVALWEEQVRGKIVYVPVDALVLLVHLDLLLGRIDEHAYAESPYGEGLSRTDLAYDDTPK